MDVITLWRQSVFYYSKQCKSLFGEVHPDVKRGDKIRCVINSYELPHDDWAAPLWSFKVTRHRQPPGLFPMMPLCQVPLISALIKDKFPLWSNDTQAEPPSPRCDSWSGVRPPSDEPAQYSASCSSSISRKSTHTLFHRIIMFVYKLVTAAVRRVKSTIFAFEM